MIDAHVHIGGEADGFIMNEEIVLKSMEKYNIDISIVSNGDSIEFGQNMEKVPKEMWINQEETLSSLVSAARTL